MTLIVPRRSALFMPASNPRALEKAKSLPCDTVIFDLEDAVSPGAKTEARTEALKAVQSGAYCPRELVVRVNGLDTPWWQDDVAAFRESSVGAILIPKVNSREDVLAVKTALDNTAVKLWAMMETPMAVLNAADICASSAQLSALVVGPNDLTKELQAQRMKGRASIQTALSLIVLAARAYGKTVLDGVYNDFKDDDGFRDECREGRSMGFDGKTLIHPNQIAGANEAFAPNADDITQAKRLIAAFETAQAEGKGAVALDGVMIEELHVTEAKNLMAFASAIAAKEKAGA